MDPSIYKHYMIGSCVETVSEKGMRTPREA